MTFWDWADKHNTTVFVLGFLFLLVVDNLFGNLCRSFLGWMGKDVTKKEDK